MATLNMRLDDDLDRRLSREADLAEQTRSELARAAIAEFLQRQERQRFLDEIARAARERGGEDPVALAEEALVASNEAFDLAERGVRQARAPYRVKRRKR
jgi:predicted transcriptional regulator